MSVEPKFYVDMVPGASKSALMRGFRPATPEDISDEMVERAAYLWDEAVNGVRRARERPVPWTRMMMRDALTAALTPEREG